MTTPKATTTTSTQSTSSVAAPNAERAERTAKRAPPAFDHAASSPRARQADIRLRVLRVTNRFRQVRSIDVAAALFPEREFKAALSAAQRAMGRLVRDKMLTRYRSLSGQTYYALAKRGADLLRENSANNPKDGQAEPSASRACEKTNPEHALWSAFAVACCEARGMTAFTERELLPRFSAGRGGAPRYPLRYTAPDGRPKGLMPDVLALEPDGQSVVWFEIDRSARGAQRLDDLVGLVGRLGSSVDLGNGTRGVLRRVVVWCKTPGILRRNRTHLTGRMPTKRGPVPRLRVGIADESALRHRGNDVYDMHKDVDVTLPKGWVQRQTLVVGQLHLQLLPTHLPGYSYRHGRARGWFDDGGLPYRPTDADWPPLHARKAGGL